MILHGGRAVICIIGIKIHSVGVIRRFETETLNLGYLHVIPFSYFQPDSGLSEEGMCWTSLVGLVVL